MIPNGLKTPFAVSLALHGAALFAAAAFFAGGAGYIQEITPMEIVEMAEEAASKATERKDAPLPEKAVKKETVRKEAPLPAPTPLSPVVPAEPQTEAPQATLPHPAPQEKESHEAAAIKTEAQAAPTAAQVAEPKVQEVTKAITAGRDAEDELGRFMAMARKKIEKVKAYPRWARERGFEGVVGVRFVIAPDGTVDEVEVVRPCHCEVLNRAACDSIKRAAPFSHPPAAYEGKRLAMEVDIGFRLE